MVGCPGCGGSSAVGIVRDEAQPWTNAADRTGARWSMRCDDCNEAWTLTD